LIRGDAWIHPCDEKTKIQNVIAPKLIWSVLAPKLPADSRERMRYGIRKKMIGDYHIN
jgi:hypothetical protein